MMTISRALAGTVAACAMAISVATPALADHGRGFGGGWRGHDRGRGFDTGSFKCRVEAGRIVDLDVRGIGRS